jgi:lysozyme
MGLAEWITHYEALRTKVYRCPAGKLTIGVGRNLEDLGISIPEAEILLANDIERCRRELEPYSWFSEAPLNVQDALIHMNFNLGLPRLLGFRRMIKALYDKDYTRAAMEALDSKWAKQLPVRANDIALAIREGL